jgi:DNA-binding NtrC family response regulator
MSQDLLTDRAAASSQAVLIWGDDAGERRAVAAAVHERSPRRNNAFVRVSCEEGVDVRLFGHAARAFTGAPDERPGVLEAANGGTVLIDDVAMLDLVTQWSVFRASETGSIWRIGDISETRIDVRFIFATGADLRPLVREGRFREDLLRRIGQFVICLPPTRELTLPESFDLDPRFREFPEPFPCPNCATPSRRFRHLRDGCLVCAACARSFNLG